MTTNTAGVPTEIRRAHGDDAAEMARLSGELGYPLAATEMARRLAVLARDERHHVAVVAAGPRLLGWIHVEHRFSLEGGDRAELMGLVVDASARRQGLGRDLIRVAESWAAARSVAELTVRSNAARELSHPFYEALGFQRHKTQHVYRKAVVADDPLARLRYQRTAPSSAGSARVATSGRGLHGVTSAALYLVGGLLVLGGLVVVTALLGDVTAGRTADRFFYVGLSVSALALGSCALLAPRARYRGGWPTVIGLCLLAFGLLGLGIELDAYLAELQDDPVTGIVIASVALFAGALLVRSGHQAHVNARQQTAGRDA